jgi:hypothetical protein
LITKLQPLIPFLCVSTKQANKALTLKASHTKQYESQFYEIFNGTKNFHKHLKIIDKI